VGQTPSIQLRFLALEMQREKCCLAQDLKTRFIEILIRSEKLASYTGLTFIFKKSSLIICCLWLLLNADELPLLAKNGRFLL